MSDRNVLWEGLPHDTEFVTCIHTQNVTFLQAIRAQERETGGSQSCSQITTHAGQRGARSYLEFSRADAWEDECDVFWNKKWEKGKKRNPSLLLAFQRTDLALQLLYRKIQVGPHGGHSSVEDAVTARELYRPVQVQWELQAASSLRAPPEDRQPDSSTDTEQYMEDQYWPEDPAQGTSGDTGEAPGPEGVRTEKLPRGAGTGRAPGAGCLAAPGV
ncbi:hypothetical protein R6Z07F_007674 [Ovis aries]